MPELIVDTTPLIRMQDMLDRLAEGRLGNTTRAMRQAGTMLFNEWRRRAADTPGVYRKPDYLAGLVSDDSIRELDPLAIDIVHTQPEIARKVHEGVPSYDMKPDIVGTLRGTPRPSNPSIMGNARQIVRNGRVVGRFNVIPFRHKGMTGAAAGQARGLEPSFTSLTGGPAQKTQWGGRLTESQIERISQHPSARRAYQALTKARAARKMKAPTFAEFIARFGGMTRVLKGYERTAQAKHMTFRAVSVRTDGRGGSKASSWIYPGWPGKDFPTEVMQALAEVVRNHIIQGLTQDLSP